MSEQPEPGPEGAGPAVPDLEAILRASQGIGQDFITMAGQLTAIHAEWRKAWMETGAFSAEESFDLVRVLVAASAGGVRFLGLSWYYAAGPE